MDHSIFSFRILDCILSYQYPFYSLVETMNVDVTGLMQKPVKGWEDRVERLCKPEAFTFLEGHIQMDYGIWRALTDGERERIQWKLLLVEQAAKYMAAGMLKGTLKYEKDSYTLEQWFAHLIGEGADQFNYALLLCNAFYANKKNDT